MGATTPVDASAQARIREQLHRTRARTLELIDPIPDESLAAQHSRLMSPIAWDLGHIAAFEELWLVDRLGFATRESDLDSTYDAFQTPRAERGTMDLMTRPDIRARLADVRRRTLARLDEAELESANPLIADGFAWDLVQQHEAQHQETILQTIQLMRDTEYVVHARRADSRPDSTTMPGTVRVPAGSFRMGAPEHGFAYDNERSGHSVRLPAFEIGAHPVTNGEYIEFIAAGGYADRDLWSDQGWAWNRQAGLFAPHYWLPRDAALAAATPDPALPGDLDPMEAIEIARDEALAGWRSRTALGVRALRANEPVIHVSCHEAEAYARYVGARLPTEAEWEKAAAWDPAEGRSLTRPWGEEPASVRYANVDQLAFGVEPIGSHPQGVSPVGCFGMHGDVWEWTASPFGGYPGFAAFPYPEYSEVFFGNEYRVLRGSSWATTPCVIRNSFRNWDYPKRRQIFSGFRIARDAT